MNPPRWEDEDHGTNDVDELRKMFRERLYGDVSEAEKAIREKIAAEVEEMFPKIDGPGWMMQDGKRIIAKEIAGKIRANKSS